ncbi:MAG: DUF6265 family protein [Bacteroidota bacterium]
MVITQILVSIIFSFMVLDPLEPVRFMEGTWKVDNKYQYEVWEVTNDSTLHGYVYSLHEGKKRIKETISIRYTNTELIYQATVPDQNQGSTISFVHNSAIEDRLSFENPDHDFPNKIQYQMISDSVLYIQVLGNSDSGFSYYMRKQPS